MLSERARIMLRRIPALSWVVEPEDEPEQVMADALWQEWSLRRSEWAPYKEVTARDSDDAYPIHPTLQKLARDTYLVGVRDGDDGATANHEARGRLLACKWREYQGEASPLGRVLRAAPEVATALRKVTEDLAAYVYHEAYLDGFACGEHGAAKVG